MPIKTALFLRPAYAAETDWGDCVARIQTPSGIIDVATLKCLEPVFARVVSIAAGFALIAFFIMFVVAAFKYLTSGGDPKGAESARNTMTYAFIGLIVIVGAWIILRFLQAVTGVDLSKFIIPEAE